jgi:hypothetical protein
MCKEKRSTFSVVDMGGDNPKSIISINVSSVRFWWSVFFAFSVLCGILWSGYTWVNSISGDRVRATVQEEIENGGSIHKFTEERILYHEEHANMASLRQQHSLEKRLMRIEFMVNTIAREQGINVMEIDSNDN